MKNILIIFSLIILFSCTNRYNDKNISDKENILIETSVSAYNINTYNDNVYQNNNEEIFELSENELIFRFGGIIYQTHITNDVNVFLLPDFESRIKDELVKGTVVQIIGISDKNEKFEENDYFWVKILYGAAPAMRDPNVGWITSNFTNVETLKVSNIEIDRSRMDSLGNLILYGTYKINDFVMEFSVTAINVEGQNFFTFSWDHTHENFHYSNLPGLYIWNEEKKELQHITYIGGQGSKWGFSSWSKITDDFKYLLQDQGTSPSRGVVIWSLKDGEEIFSAGYNIDINLKGYTIEIYQYYGEYYAGKWTINRENFTEGEINFVNIFMEENEPPKELVRIADLAQGNGLALLIIYEYNIHTKERRIIGGKYIGTM